MRRLAGRHAEGHVAFDVHPLTLGPHVFTASFDGTPIFTTSQASATVDVYDYALSVTTSAQTVRPREAFTK